MNKTAITIGFFVLAGLGVVGSIAVLLITPTSLDRFIGIVVTVLAIASTGAVTFYGMEKQSRTIETIQTQTNGNTTALIDEVRRLNTLLALAPAVVTPAVLPDGLTEYTQGN